MTEIQKNKLCFFTYSRDAINCIIKELNINNENILIPDYVCSELIESLNTNIKNIFFYKIDSNLKYDENEIITLINKKKIKIIFLVDYFGVETNITIKLKQFIRNKNIYLIKDASHSYLSLLDKNFEYDKSYDFVVSSIYKNVDINVGSIAIGLNNYHANFIDFFLFIKRLFINNLKKIFEKNQVFINYQNNNLKFLKLKNKVYIAPKKILNFFFFYNYLLEKKNLKKEIIDKKLNTIKLFKIFLKRKDCKSVFTLKEIQSNVLQFYPIIFNSKNERNNFIDKLSSLGILAITWPTFHSRAPLSKIWENILLIKINDINVQILKDV